MPCKIFIISLGHFNGCRNFSNSSVLVQLSVISEQTMKISLNSCRSIEVIVIQQAVL